MIDLINYKKYCVHRSASIPVSRIYEMTSELNGYPRWRRMGNAAAQATTATLSIHRLWAMRAVARSGNRSPPRSWRDGQSTRCRRCGRRGCRTRSNRPGARSSLHPLTVILAVDKFHVSPQSTPFSEGPITNSTLVTPFVFMHCFYVAP